MGNNLTQCIRDKSNILEHMVKDGMLDDVYEEGFGLNLVNEYIADMAVQIAHRYPRMNILEIGQNLVGLWICRTELTLPQVPALVAQQEWFCRDSDQPFPRTPIPMSRAASLGLQKNVFAIT